MDNNKLEPFKFWAQKVLPLVYDDSVSYYEVLCKVVEYINQTLDNVDTLHTDVTGLHEAYVQLQGYVNTYFDSLDVQAEINNKLDNMVIDGTLSGLIDPRIPNAVSAWLNENVNPVGSAVIVDPTLTISGAAADAKVTGDNITNLKADLTAKEEAFNEVVNYSEQLLKADDATVGYYWTINSSGVLAKGGGGTNRNSIYPQIPVKANVTYYYKNLYAYFCILDDGGTLSRLTDNTTTAHAGSFTPQNDGHIYVTTAPAAPNPKILTNAPFGNKTTQSDDLYNVSLAVDGYVHIKVAITGDDYDYRNPILAVRNIKDSSASKQYMLDIYPGTYNLQDAIRSSEQTGSMWGLMLPDYVHMRGIGERDDIIINCSLPDDSTASTVQYTSTLNLKQNNMIENLTFTGTNVRYVVHDESSNTLKDWKRMVKNCRFVHNGNVSDFWAYTYAWAEGCSSGSYSYFEDCIFENYSYVAPYSFHTNTNFDSACTHVFKNCQFIKHYIGSNSAGAFMVDDIQCGKPINIEFIGCSFNSFLFVQNHSSSTDIEEINITGHDNNPVYINVYRPNVSTPKRIFTKFSDEVAVVNNPYSAIAAGKPLRYSNFVRNEVRIVQSNGLECVGIALDDIPSNGIGYMKYAGILQASAHDITGITSGTKIGVVNYTVSAVTDGTDFARAIQNNIIKFN